MDFLNSSSNLRGDFLLFTILKSPFKICVYLFKSISKNVSTLLGYMQNGLFNIQAWGGIPELDRDIIYFPNEKPSDIHADVWNPLYELKKGTTGYRLVEVTETSMETDKYDPKKPAEKLEVEDPAKVSEEEEKVLIEAMREANKDYLPETVEFWIEPEEGLIVLYEDGSEDIIPLDQLIKKKEETLDNDKEELIEGIQLEEIPSIPEENILAEEVYQGDIINLEDNVKGLPEGSNLEVLEAVTSDVAGNFEAKVKVIFKNGSSRIITISVTVKERISVGTIEEIPNISVENILEEVVYQGDPITLEDNIQGLPEGS